MTKTNAMFWSGETLRGRLAPLINAGAYLIHLKRGQPVFLIW